MLSADNRAILKKTLRKDEGVEHKAYFDTKGFITIGVGRNLSKDGLSDLEIEYLLDNNVNNVLNELSKRLKCWNKINGIRKLVLSNMAFNMGVPELLKFSKMLEALAREDYKKASEEMLESQWAIQVKGRANRLSYIMLKGTIESVEESYALGNVNSGGE